MSTTKSHGNNLRNDRCVGTIPLTIAQAIDVCNRYNQKKYAKQSYNKNVETNTNSNLPSPAPIVDLLAIVSCIETNHNSNPKRSSLYVRIWILDSTTSLLGTSNTTSSPVQVLCFGPRRYTELMDQLQIRSGDIMRFNRIVTMPSKDKDMNALTFTYDIQNPEIGPEYYRFGNVNDEDFFNSGTILHQRNELQQGEDVPLSMLTNPQCINRLIEWYRRSHSPATDKMICSVHNQHLPTANNLLLNSLPCQHRSLMEFQSCIGLIGHVTVCVLQIEKLTSTPFRTKQQHSSNNASATTTQTFVTLIDYSSTSSTTGMTQAVALVIDSTSETDPFYFKFHSILSLAHSSNRPVVLTNMTSIKNSPNPSDYRYAPHSLLSDNADGILIPTTKSDIKLIQNPVSERKHDRELSQPQATIIPFVPIKHKSSTRTTEVIRILSPILNINVLLPDGRKLLSSDTNDIDQDSCIESLLSLIFPCPMNDDDNDDDSGYKSIASIQLNTNDSTKEVITVEADVDTFSCLFGVGFYDFSLELDRRQRKRRRSRANILANDISSIDCDNFVENMHRKLVKLLFQSLLKEKVGLRWLIQKVRYKEQRHAAATNNEFNHYVINVSLEEF